MTLAEIVKAHEFKKPVYQSDRCGYCGDFCHCSLDGETYCDGILNTEALIQMVMECRPFLENEGNKCACGDVGYFASGSNSNGWEQEQCEFCYCHPTSEFNRLALLKRVEELL